MVYDATGSTGVRTVVCEGVLLDVYNNMDIYVALAGFEYNGTVRYSLAMTMGQGINWKSQVQVCAR